MPSENTKWKYVAEYCGSKSKSDANVKCEGN